MRSLVDFFHGVLCSLHPKAIFQTQVFLKKPTFPTLLARE
jgi:hypothetical protein